VELSEEDLSCYLNNIQYVGLWKCLYDHYLANKAYIIDIAVKNIYKSFTHKMATKASWRRNYVTVTLSQWQTFLNSFYLQDGGKNQLA